MESPASSRPKADKRMESLASSRPRADRQDAALPPSHAASTRIVHSGSASPPPSSTLRCAIRSPASSPSACISRAAYLVALADQELVELGRQRPFRRRHGRPAIGLAVERVRRLLQGERASVYRGRAQPPTSQSSRTAPAASAERRVASEKSRLERPQAGRRARGPPPRAGQGPIGADQGVPAAHRRQRRRRFIPAPSFAHCRLERRQQRRHLVARGLPENITVDIEIGVNWPVAHRDDLTPRHQWQMTRGCHLGRRLAENLGRAHQREQRSARARPAMNRATVSAASTMWRIRIRSSGGILHQGRPDHFAAEVPAQILGRWFGARGRSRFISSIFTAFLRSMPSS